MQRSLDLLPRYFHLRNARESRSIHILCRYLQHSTAAVKSKVHRRNQLQCSRHTPVIGCTFVSGTWRRAGVFRNKHPCGADIAARISSFPCVTGLRAMATGTSTTNGTSSPAKQGQRRNRLANEKSPYLLQHASNPVDW